MKSTLDVFEGMMLFFLRESKATLTRETLDELLEAWYELRRAAEAEEPRAAEGVGLYEGAEEPRDVRDPQGPQDAVPYEETAAQEAGEDPSTSPQGGSAQDDSGPGIPEGFEVVQPVKGFTGTGAKLKRETLEKLEQLRAGGVPLAVLADQARVSEDTLRAMIRREKVELKIWEKVSKALEACG